MQSDFCPKIQFWQNPNIFTSFSPNFFFLQFFSWNQSCQQLKSPKPQHFHEFFTQIFFFTIFLVKSKLSTAKKPKSTKFSRVFHPKKNDKFLGRSKLNFWIKMKISNSVPLRETSYPCGKIPTPAGMSPSLRESPHPCGKFPTPVENSS